MHIRKVNFYEEFKKKRKMASSQNILIWCGTVTWDTELYHDSVKYLQFMFVTVIYNFSELL